MKKTQPTHVLLVEDHAVNQRVVTRMLERMGCVVVIAEDGEAGVARASEPCPGGYAPYDLLLMDLSMPKVDGLEATRRIRALAPPYRNVSIVALTAHATPADRERCLAAGMDGWLTKPITPEDLAATLRRHTNWTAAPADAVLAGILDTRVVDGLVDLAGPDDPDFFPSLVSEFRDTALQALATAEAQQRAGQLGELRRSVHVVKSAGSTVGALRVRAACARIEAADDGTLLELGATWLELAADEVQTAARALGAAWRCAS